MCRLNRKSFGILFSIVHGTIHDLKTQTSHNTHTPNLPFSSCMCTYNIPTPNSSHI
ncbi:unnamed protein product [Periconia digitata]|uniref:Uncharacterized protein n=1 Tax=Periconia digitata TaxID=1303443 RepID=A0A9W4U5K2_9PLEO|nr:unnamed protein product [Periconia digitata]